MPTGRARLAGVMGWPIAHSRSPRLHGYWLDQYGIDGVYLPLAVRPEHFEAALRALPKLGFRGTNLTLPHKQAALGVCDAVDPQAARIGAVNTIVVGDQGELRGSNSDAFGFLENLRVGAPRWRAQAGPAIVLGAGGAARAVAVALLDAGVPELRLVNRTHARACRLADDLNDPRVNVRSWPNWPVAFTDGAMLVNATSLGMQGQPPLEIDLTALPPGALVHDIVYTPLRTPLLDAAAIAGHPIVDGLGMLLHQARPGFAAWFGMEPEVTEGLRHHVMVDL